MPRQRGPRPGVYLDVEKIADIIMKDRDQTITQFARDARMNRQTVTNILSSGRRVKRLTANRIARGLGLNVEDILADSDDEAELRPTG
jgi:plasmid maintenance system antidote protein VapI